MDIDGGMRNDIYESMAEGVERAACVCCTPRRDRELVLCDCPKLSVKQAQSFLAALCTYAQGKPSFFFGSG